MKYEVVQTYNADNVANSYETERLLAEGWEPFAAFSRSLIDYDPPLYKEVKKTIEVLLFRRIVKNENESSSNL